MTLNADGTGYTVRVRHGPAAAARPAGPADRLRRPSRRRAGVRHGRHPDGRRRAGAADPAGRARLALALAFLNAIPWDPGAAAPAPDSDPAAQEAAQYDVEFSGPFSILDFIELGRASVDQADGGSANWNVGINYESVLATSPFHRGCRPCTRPPDSTSALTCRT